MLHPFYADYLIDDQNLWCGRIIAVQCDWTHVYIDPCEILLDCFDGWPEIDWCDMTNSTTDPDQPWVQWANAWNVLRVTNDGSCVEFVPPEVAFPFEDIRVKVSENDTTSDFLIEKLVSCDPTVLSIVERNDGGEEFIEFCVNVPDSFLDLDDTPSDYSCRDISYQSSVPDNRGFVMFNINGVEFECDGRQLWWSWYRTNDITIEYPTQHINNYPWWSEPYFEFFGEFSTSFPTYSPPALMDIYEWNPDMNGWNGRIVIPRTWMYKIEAHWQAVVNWWYDALRLLIVAVWDAWAKTIIADDKFGWDSFSSMVNLAMPDCNNAYVSFQPNNLVRLDAWTELVLWCRSSVYIDYDNILYARDTIGNTNISLTEADWTSRVTFFRSSLVWWIWPWFPDNWQDVWNPFSWLTFRVSYYWPYLYNAT